MDLILLVLDSDYNVNNMSMQCFRNVTEKMSQSLVPFREQVNNGNSYLLCLKLHLCSWLLKWCHQHIVAVFWNVVRGVLSRHDYQRYLLLGEITTDWGRGRAWLRAALNEHSLERYLQMILCEEEKMSEFYEPWAFLRDAERSSMLPTMAAGISAICISIWLYSFEMLLLVMSFWCFRSWLNTICHKDW